VIFRQGPWIKANNERLKVLVAQGAVRAFAAFKRTQPPVRVQACKIGAPFPPLRIARKKWAEASSNVWQQY
jgi:hypothetical protein